MCAEGSPAVTAAACTTSDSYPREPRELSGDPSSHYVRRTPAKTQVRTTSTGRYLTRMRSGVRVAYRPQSLFPWSAHVCARIVSAARRDPAVPLPDGAVALGRCRAVRRDVVHDRLAVDQYLAARRRSTAAVSCDGEEGPRRQPNRDLVWDRRVHVVRATAVAVDDACTTSTPRYLVDHDVVSRPPSRTRRPGAVEAATVGELRTAGVEGGLILRRVDTCRRL